MKVGVFILVYIYSSLVCGVQGLDLEIGCLLLAM
jgi:hypothetical protein